MNTGIQLFLSTPVKWAESVNAHWEKADQPWVVRVLGSRVLFLLVSEALVLVAAVYHAVALTAKLVPASVRLLLITLPVAKTQRLGRYIPEWAVWHRLKTDHAAPLLKACPAGLFAAISCLDRRSPSYMQPVIRKHLLPQSEPPVRRLAIGQRMWSVITHPAFLGTAAGCAIIGTAVFLGGVYLQFERERRVREQADCENAGDVWHSGASIDGEGWCDTTRSDYRRKKTACENAGNIWKDYGLGGWGRCDDSPQSKTACEKAGNVWNDWGNGYCETMDPQYRNKKADCERVGSIWKRYRWANSGEGWCDDWPQKKKACEKAGYTWREFSFLGGLGGWCDFNRQNRGPLPIHPTPNPLVVSGECSALKGRDHKGKAYDFSHLKNVCAQNNPSKEDFFPPPQAGYNTEIGEWKKKFRYMTKLLHPDKTKDPKCNFYSQCVNAAYQAIRG